MTHGKTECEVCGEEFVRPPEETGAFICSHCKRLSPELPRGMSVFEPQGADGEFLVLRTPDGETHKIETERAHDLGQLLIARTRRKVSDSGG